MTFRAANNVDKLSKLFFSSGYKIAVQIAKTGDSDPAKKESLTTKKLNWMAVNERQLDFLLSKLKGYKVFPM